MKVDISVVIPCYNRISLLKETLKSVEKAISSLNAEIILVDDGSDTPIEDQLPEFVHLPILFLRQINSGLTASRYNGLLRASGDYVLFLDSDDQIAADKLTVQIAEMKIQDADISHSDILECKYTSDGGVVATKTSIVPHSFDAPSFFLKVQPAPHGPVFKTEYLLKYLTRPFIPLTRQYDSIGEIWFYYNLCVYPAKIIKIDQPLTIAIHHNDERLTDHWERMGLCALTLQFLFAKHCPPAAQYTKEAKKEVAHCAFKTFRGLPYNVNTQFQSLFLEAWKRLGKNTITELDGGKYFTLLAKLLGPVAAAKILKRFLTKDYETIRTISAVELEDKLNKIALEFK